MGQTPILTVEHIHTYYGQSHILQGVNLSVDEGKIVAVLGRNGVGKTTLIRSLIGFSIPREGTIYFKGKDITHLDPAGRVDAGLALVPQGRRIFGSLTVDENLLSSARKRTGKAGHTGQAGHGNSWDRDRVFTLFPQLKDRRKVRASLLSGGEQQMLAIARALVSNPDLLLLDEPTEGLSPSMVKEVIKILSELEKEGQSILLVEQNLRFALDVAEHVYILSRGSVVYDSTSLDLSRRPDIQLLHLGVSTEAKS
ncbi:MAG: high-affinity branched-chain amino acid transport ATP-binding protein [Deltaproteobacteria bacterium]|jgi:branched-chain amino acid transport system ATP-binding protein|nr:high-affinity branched-chain amino acid transport ATP-binding protein [Deltaproteobacteria bacterium]